MVHTCVLWYRIPHGKVLNTMVTLKYLHHGTDMVNVPCYFLHPVVRHHVILKLHPMVGDTMVPPGKCTVGFWVSGTAPCGTPWCLATPWCTTWCFTAAKLCTTWCTICYGTTWCSTTMYQDPKSHGALYHGVTTLYHGTTFSRVVTDHNEYKQKHIAQEALDDDTQVSECSLCLMMTFLTENISPLDITRLKTKQ